MINLTMLVLEGLWKDLELWARKTIECLKIGELFHENLENKRV